MVKLNKEEPCENSTMTNNLISASELKTEKHSKKKHKSKSTSESFVKKSTNNNSNDDNEVVVLPKIKEEPTSMDYYATNHSQNTVLKAHIDKLTECRPHACEFCEKAFKTKYVLTRHRRVHTGERPYKCDFVDCNSAFADKATLSIHERTHTGYKPFICSFCGKDFVQTSDLYKHQTKHTGWKAYECEHENCGKGFALKKYLIKHLECIHNKPSPFSCAVCSRGFILKTFLLKHVEKSHPEYATQNQNQQELQKFIIVNNINDVSHNQNHNQKIKTEPQQIKIKSEPIDENSPTRKNNNNNKNNLKKYECGGCNKKYSNRPRLKRHRKRRDHPAFKPHECPMCHTATFKTINGLEKHFYSHSEEEREKLLH